MSSSSSASTTHPPNSAWFTGAFVFALVAVVGSFGWPYVYPPGRLTAVTGPVVEKAALGALLLGSAVALALAVVLGRQMSQRRRKRSWKSWSLTVVAAVTAIPGACVGGWFVFWFVYSQLPLSSSEARAVAVAEQFIYRNGYTTAGHPKDFPVLQNDIMDPLAGSEENLLEMRKGTLEPRAFGVRSLGPISLVFFESSPPNPYGAYRTVEVDVDGNARIMHQEMFPGMYKKTER